MNNDKIRISRAAERNREPIFQVLQRVLAPSGTLVEVASGTGTHAAYLVPRLGGWHWQPTDPDPEALVSIAARQSAAGDSRFKAPLRLDVHERWPVIDADAVFCANMIHIAPWSATAGLFSGAAGVLTAGDPLILYGPFHIDGPTGPGNVRFDASLQGRDPRWGIRELGAVQAVGLEHGFVLDEVVAMPADNRTVVFRRR